MEAASTGPSVHGSGDIPDGGQRIVLENGESTLVVDPAQGGRWTTWDLALAGGHMYRLLSAPGARVHAGRAELAAEGGIPALQTGLGPASPSGLGDHFLPLGTTQRDFALGTARELGTFAGQPFTASLYSPGRGEQEVALRAEGGIQGPRRVTPLILLKKLALGRPGSEIAIHYRIENPGDKPVQVLFGVEFCLALDATAVAAGAGHVAYEFDGVRERGGYGVRGVAKNTTAVALLEPQPGVTVRLGWERSAAVWVSPAPAGAAGTDQVGASILPVWDLRLPPEDNWAVNIWLQAGPSRPVAPLPPELVARVARWEAEDMPWK